MKNNYKNEYHAFDTFLKCNNYEIKDTSDNEIEICDSLSKIEIDSIPKIAFDYNNINNMFLKSIEVLGKDTKKELRSIIPKIKVVRKRQIENGSALAIGSRRKLSIHVTKNPYENVDFIAYSHELGHIPALILGGKGDYIEYSETLSIFFEYLSCLNLYNNDAKKIFLNARLQVAKSEAKNILEMDKDNSYLEVLKRDNLKYIYSLEYALNLIELFNNDPMKLRKVIDDIVCGCYSFRIKEEELGLNIDSCKKLLKEIG